MTELVDSSWNYRLIDTFVQHPYALVFAGQGVPWLGTLAQCLAQGADKELSEIVESAHELLAPVAGELLRIRPHGFQPIQWAWRTQEQEHHVPDYVNHAASSVPGIYLSQIALLSLLEAQGLPSAQAVSVLGHSQGVLAVYAYEQPERKAEILAIAQLIGAAITRRAQQTGLVQVGSAVPMIAVDGISRTQLVHAIEESCAHTDQQIRPVIGLCNGRKKYVIVGRPKDNEKVIAYLAQYGEQYTVKPKITPLNISAGFHHPAMLEGVEQVVAWAKHIGVDYELARQAAQAVMFTPVDWQQTVEHAQRQGIRWFLDVGPDTGVEKITNALLIGTGARSLCVSTEKGQQQLFDVGAAPHVAQPYSNFLPRLVRDDESTEVRLATKFTELTGCSPILLAGMTPTTVDPEIVAAAANAGHWAELAGGGQVTPEIAQHNLEKLTQLLQPGVNAQFNSMFLDPKLWQLHIAGKALIPKARAQGKPINGIVISAGIPDKDEAVALLRDLRARGFSWIAFKPGAITQIQQVIAIAKATPELPIIMQVEGGKAGGHHSWEDLDDLLLATYNDIREQENLILCVGGGIGTPEQATHYLTGEWAKKYEFPAMPVDGILLGTAAMATKEAKTSHSVKELLVATQGSDTWVRPGQSRGGMTSGRSQLGADIHEIDNSFAKAGRLLDELAGDAESIAQRKAEIIAAINKTAKPYFGDLDSMTYAQWLERYLELSGPQAGTNTWQDHSWFTRFSHMIDRTQSRLSDVDHGSFTAAITLSTDDDPRDIVEKLTAMYDTTHTLHPADRAWFLQLARSAGKPVNFVPIIDKDVRGWWRSDSLWQSHDDRYDADQVAIIPGIAAVSGITQLNEPVAELFARFNRNTIQALEQQGVAPQQQETTILERIIHATGTYWAGRHMPSLTALIGAPDTWRIDNTAQEAYHAGTGAQLTTEDAEHALLRIPLHRPSQVNAQQATPELEIRLELLATSPRNAVPVVTTTDAEQAMDELIRIAAGGTLGEVDTQTGHVHWRATFDDTTRADYHNVLASCLPHSLSPATTAPDALVGLAWPAIFAAVKEAHIPGKTDARVSEGMLSLVHLEHRIEMCQQVPTQHSNIDVSAHVEHVADTALGRLIEVRAELTVGKNNKDDNDSEGRKDHQDGQESQEQETVARLTERFIVRGRKGKHALPEEEKTTHQVQTPRAVRAHAVLNAPSSMAPFAAVSGDHNPIHVSDIAARLAGLPQGVIVHGMWTSAIAQLVATSGDSEHGTAPAQIREYKSTMLAPILPGQQLEVEVYRVGFDTRPGYGEIREITITVDNGEKIVLKATAIMAAPKTMYVFPGQGIQSQGMGMAARQESAAARALWDQADHYTRTRLGFSVLEIVQNNPHEVIVDGEKFAHPQGVLFLTQFTQVAMATLAIAQVAQLREAQVLDEQACFAGHSVGEYNALAAYAQVIPLEAILAIVYRRGLTMHRLVERDAAGNSNFGLAALRPHKMGLNAAEVFDYVRGIAAESGEFLEIVNYNVAGRQYAVAGTYRGLKILEEKTQQRAPGERAFILIPGIDVPFHSSHLLGGVDDFREHLDQLIPADLDLSVLVDRYIPNLVARPFALSKEFVAAILDVVDSPILAEVHKHFDAHLSNPTALGRLILIELLAWQFASPVRWIETQELVMRAPEQGGLGIEHYIEVGVGSAPTLANLMGQTLSLPEHSVEKPELEVLNVERDQLRIFAKDEQLRVIEDTTPHDDTAETAHNIAQEPSAYAQVVPQAESAPAAPASPPADIEFSISDATRMLVALWTKVRPEQITAADSIETLVEGVSSRRNQLLLDLGVEFNLGAIDGAADAPLDELAQTVTSMAKGYQPFGSVLGDAISDALRRLTGPASQRPHYIAERISTVWQLGQGWIDNVHAELTIATREGASLRGGELATLLPVAPKNTQELDQLIDAAINTIAVRLGVSVAPATAPATNSAHEVISTEALSAITGDKGVLAHTARTLLRALGLTDPSAAQSEVHDRTQDEENAQLYAAVTQELGTDWIRQTQPCFQPEKAVQLDDRWASAREDISRVALGELAASAVDITGAGKAAAAQAAYFGLHELAAQAQDTQALPHSEDVAVVTGASPYSIAAAVVAQLLAQGATVIATTSSLSHERMDFYKQLYRENARGSACLWVVPANIASYRDIDALAQWIGTQQRHTVNGSSQLIKPALYPTLLFPFAAPKVHGTLADAGPQAESQMRVLLWGVERLIAQLAALGADTNVHGTLHIVLPGSPNRGKFGGDGAYGEAKAALDALVQRWHAEPLWRERTLIAHILIGWVRGTGLMAGNDPLVAAVEAQGVRTYSTDEMARNIMDNVTAQARTQAATMPIVADYTGGLAEKDIDLAGLAQKMRSASNGTDTQDAHEEHNTQSRLLPALPNMAKFDMVRPDFSGQVTQSLDDMIVIVGAGELGPWGSSRTRFEAEMSGELSAAGVAELAWSMGLIHWDTNPEPGWYDRNDEYIAESDIYPRFREEVLGRVGVRQYHDDGDMVSNLAPELTTIYLDQDLSFSVSTEEEAYSFVNSAPESTQVVYEADTDEWRVTRKAGSAVQVPRRMAMSRFVGGQIPEGFDPAVYGIPADMIDNLDRLAVWNLVCTVDAFLSSGFSPAELLAHVHPGAVSSTQGTGLGGTSAMHSLYIDGLLGNARQNDILQEALPNVIAAHVMQSYIGGYGQMVHPTAACATAAVSLEEAVDKIALGKSDFVVAGGFDDLSVEGITGFGDMAATADSQQLRDKGIPDRYFSRANDRRRAGFIESAGGGTILVARARLAAQLGLPVLGVIAYAESFADGAHTSIPAPGLGALGAARGGQQSRLYRGLAQLGVHPDDITIVSKHDTSTTANDPNESQLHERLARALGRSEGNPLYVISQKTVTGHAKGGAAAFQAIGLTQVLNSALVPANYSLDCVDPVLAEYEHLVWLRQPLNLAHNPPKAGLLTSLGFGHVSALVAIVHAEAFYEALRQEQGETAATRHYEQAQQRLYAGYLRILSAMYGGAALYERPVNRNLGAVASTGTPSHKTQQYESEMLLSTRTRLQDGVLRAQP
ncbi:fatty acid synthase subunit beta domain-containing protein [Corynebacterium sp. SY003]|uniref:fatty acid synthase subunit beta domain-containing protein n=1 Tax=Corynebacterium sp. SY003 TaxID=2499164 RepID=UPI00351B3848